MTTDPEYAFKAIGAKLSNWGRWGVDDQLGTLNLITPERRAAAAGLITTGEIIDLAMPLDGNGPQPGPVGWRFNPIHQMTMLPTDGGWPAGFQVADDVVILPLQAATQWDALAHVGYDGYLYNGVSITTVTARGGAAVNSFDKVVDKIVGRGVLLDIAALKGVDRLAGGYEITADDLDAAVAAQGVDVGAGDILLVRTGWYRHFLEGSHDIYVGTSVPGLGVSCCEWLHAHDIAALAADNGAVEVKPSSEPPATHPVHMVLIRDLGMTLGEMFHLEELAAHCARTRRWAFFISAVGLKVSNAVGSAVTPIVIT
jgi:kynurenine formamidase